MTSDAAVAICCPCLRCILPDAGKLRAGLSLAKRQSMLLTLSLRHCLLLPDRLTADCVFHIYRWQQQAFHPLTKASLVRRPLTLLSQLMT